MNSKFRFTLLALLLIMLIGIGMIYNSQKSRANDENEEKTVPFSTLSFLDIGSKTKKGTSTITNDELIISARGSNIWGTKDEFSFGYKTIKGDFDLCVQVLSLSVANLYTKAGIMARKDLGDNSQHVFFHVFPDNSPRKNNNGGCEFQYRKEEAGEMKVIYPYKGTASNQFDVAFPNIWIRLKRQNDVFESFFSSDNKTWKLYSSFIMKMPEKLLVGLAVTSHDPENSTSARFASFLSKI